MLLSSLQVSIYCTLQLMTQHYISLIQNDLFLNHVIHILIWLQQRYCQSRHQTPVYYLWRVSDDVSILPSIQQLDQQVIRLQTCEIRLILTCCYECLSVFTVMFFQVMGSYFFSWSSIPMFSQLVSQHYIICYEGASSEIVP